MSGDDLRLTSAPAITAGLLIRRPPAEVFRAFADPAVTTKFWFTKSSGPMVPGAKLRWDWEMYGASAEVAVEEVERDGRIVFDWGDPARRTTVEMRFVPWRDDSTYVQVTETGHEGTGDEMAAYAVDSTAGFTKVLCAAKALLEHDVVLTIVLDSHPEGLEL